MSILILVCRATMAAVAGAFILTLAGGPAQASDNGRLPPPPLPVPTSGSMPAPGSGPAQAATPAVSPPTGSATAAPAGQTPEAAADTVSTKDLNVVAGAAEDKRKALLGRIMEAKSQGIGTSTYMMAFDSLEQSVKGGESEENVLKRVSSLNNSLDEQFKRSVILKTQRPAPPIAASDPTAPYGSAGGALKNTDTAALIQKLQSKYGAQIPDLQNKYGGKIPGDLKDKLSGAGGDPSALLKNPEIQDLIKKFGK